MTNDLALEDNLRRSKNIRARLRREVRNLAKLSSEWYLWDSRDPRLDNYNRLVRDLHLEQCERDAIRRSTKG